MSLIVAARFTTFPAAEDAAQKLFNAGFVEEDVTLFFVNPRGQHARYPIGGDTGTDPGAREAPKGAGIRAGIAADRITCMLSGRIDKEQRDVLFDEAAVEKSLCGGFSRRKRGKTRSDDQ